MPVIKIPEKWKEKLEAHPITLMVGFVTSLLMIATLAGRADWWNQKLSAMIFAGIVGAKTSQAVSPWLLYFMDFLFVSIPILGLLLTQAEVRRRKAVRDRSETSTIAHKTMLGMMRAATRLKHQEFPDSPAQLKSYVSVENMYLIHSDFTTEVTRRYQLKASKDVVHFWEIKIFVNAKAQAMDYLDNIDFKVESEDKAEGKDVVYLPIENDGFRKRVIIYFLPPMQPGEPKARTITAKYKWPKMLAQVDKIGEEPFEWEFDSAENIEHVKFGFFMEPGTGKILDCEVGGPRYQNPPKTDKPEHPERGWPGFVYEIKDVPAGKATFQITIRAKKP